jgi:Protein of unknown function (DUF2934)
MEKEDRIRRRAHEIWEQEGRPEGREKHHWEQASREVEGQPAKAAKTRKAPSKAKPSSGTAKSEDKAAKPAAEKPRRTNSAKGATLQ